VPELIRLIKDLAEYELSPDEAVATELQLHDALFGGAGARGGRPAVYAHVVEGDGTDERALAGMAIWFLNFSTWLGSHGIYLEDLFVRPEYRGRGYGKALLSELARIALARGYQRLEWWVLDWNEPALDFYRSIGATPMSEWTVQRMSVPELTDLARAVPRTD